MLCYRWLQTRGLVTTEKPLRLHISLLAYAFLIPFKPLQLPPTQRTGPVLFHHPFPQHGWSSLTHCTQQLHLLDNFSSRIFLHPYHLNAFFFTHSSSPQFSHFKTPTHFLISHSINRSHWSSSNSLIALSQLPVSQTALLLSNFKPHSHILKLAKLHSFSFFIHLYTYFHAFYNPFPLFNRSSPLHHSFSNFTHHHTIFACHCFQVMPQKFLFCRFTRFYEYIFVIIRQF